MKRRSYKVNGHAYAVTAGLVYDPEKAAMVPCVVVERPGPLGRGLAFAHAKNASEGVQKLCACLSIPETRIEEYAV